MKKLFTLSFVLLIFLLNGCDRQMEKRTDPEAEKAAIQALFDENVRVIIQNDPQKYVDFMRSHDKPSSYIVYQDSIIFNEEYKKSDAELKEYLLPEDFSYTKFEFTRPLIINVSADAKMATVIAGFLVEVENTSPEGIRRMQNTYTVLQVLEKGENGWLFGDYMQYIGE